MLDSLVPTANILTFLWLLYTLVYATKRMLRGSRNTINFVFPVHFVFCGVPLLLDTVVGTPPHDVMPGFAIATSDPATSLVYCAYVSACPIIWIMFGTAPHSYQDDRSFTITSKPLSLPTRLLLSLLVALPVILVITSPDPSFYSTYTPHSRHISERWDAAFYHVFVGKSCLLSIVAASVLLASARQLPSALLASLPFIAATCWINGKRNAVAFALVALLFALWRRTDVSRKTLVVVALLSAVFLGLFSDYYQKELRFSQQFTNRNGSWHFWYDSFRIDYGRDDVIKLTIYSELYPETGRILEYRLQTLPLYIATFYPRRLWPDKPDAYARHLTIKAMDRVPPGGGGLTTSVLEEFISNFGPLGFLLGPLTLIAVSRLGDRSRNLNTRALSVLVTIFLQVVHFAPWAVIGLLWVMMICWEELGKAGTPTRSRLASPATFQRKTT